MEKRLRYRDLEALGIVRSRTSLGHKIKKFDFPPGKLTGENTRTWGEDEVQAWLDSRPTATRVMPPLKSGKRRGRPRKATQPESTVG